MTATFFFFYQQRGKEDEWRMRTAAERSTVLALQPAFMTVLDLSSIPDDGDWSKIRYRGPFYADFDAGDDLDLVCDQFKTFLAKLDSELSFDITQARLYASGSKGFHIEIPQECFIPKVPPNGTPWLAYIYRTMAESLFVETLDLNVYTGKRGRQWRTTNVLRDNGCYKVPITLEDALTMTPELYRELIKEPRTELAVTPPSTNAQFVNLFERGRDKVVTAMRGKKKRIEKANEVLDPWRKAGRTPPTIERIMAGLELADNAGFQSIAMQLSIYATSVGMPLAEFLDRSKGVVENHVSDGVRYNSATRRRDELIRMWEYMSENSLYDFEVGPLVRLVKQGTDTSDLGVYETEDRHDRAVAKADAVAERDSEDGDEAAEGAQAPVLNLDMHRGLRRGFFMNADGMFRRNKDDVEPICRATLRQVDAFYDAEKGEFLGYEFDLVISGKRKRRTMAGSDVFTSAANLRKFFAAHQISYQGSESDAAALMDIMAEKAERGNQVYVYPREGFFVLNNPEIEKPTPVKVFLTKDTFITSVAPESEDYFTLKYRPTGATSAYDIDIQWAPALDDTMRDSLHDIFTFNKPTVVADMLGWMVAAHYRSVYLKLFGQFPMLQAYGEAGSGKTQTVKMMAHLHWYDTGRISVKSAMGFTRFALEAHASSSTSAPFIIDEYKPREMKSVKGKFEMVKDLFKASYVGGDIGERGTVNKGAENSLGLIKSRSTAPIAFMGEAIEMETAILERSVNVGFSKAWHDPKRTAAFNRLCEDPTVLSAIGRGIVEAGFQIDLDKMREEVKAIRTDIELRLDALNSDPDARRMAPRMIFNRVIVTHALTSTLRFVLRQKFGNEFDPYIDALLAAKDTEEDSEDNQVVKMHSMSEASKVLSRLALMSRDRDAHYEMIEGKDYYVGEGWIELLIEKAYDKYRLYCVAHHDTPLFDNLYSFTHAMNSYSPCIDRVCAGSALRVEGSTERVVRFDLRSLAREGVQTFKT